MSEDFPATQHDVPAAVLSALDQLEKLDPSIRAFVDEPDRRRRLLDTGLKDGPLRGVAVGVKDLYRVDGLATRAGSELPSELFEGNESLVVSRLNAAGAAVIGKTAMDEFAWCEPPATKNPRDLRRTPGGSSGGSAAAVAAGICPVAIGSQTLQSTIVPAAYCGVIGFKPTYERVPFDGVALAPTFDTVGFLSHDLESLAAVLRAVVPEWTESTGGMPVLGVPEAWGTRRLHGEGWAAFARQCKILEEAGFELPAGRLPWNEDLVPWSGIVGDLVHAEFAAVHRSWFDRYAHLYRPRTRDAVSRGLGITRERVEECRAARDQLIKLVDRVTEDAGVDAWICPATGSVAPLGYGSTGDSWLTSFWSMAGLPSISLPVFDGEDGLPHGLQIVGRSNRDEDLLGWACQVGPHLHSPSRESSG